MIKLDRQSLLCAGAAIPILVSSASASANNDPVRSVQVEDIVVTGSRLSGAERLTNVEILGQKELQAAGITDLSQITRLIGANSGSENLVDQLNNPQSSGTAQINLRNLGLGSTLVLVDGQRWTNSAVVATDGSAFVDINSLIPTIALQRVEVVKDGASAIYGSDAVAGVVNFISRKTVDRPELRAKYATNDGSDESVIEGIGGFDLFDGRLILAASHFHRSALGSDERDFTQAERYGRASWSAVSSYGQPGSYYRPSSGAYVADADCDNPAFVGSYRNTPEDPFCRLDYSDFFDLTPEETRTQIFADYRKDAGEVSYWGQAAWASTHTRARQTPSLPILSRTLTIPELHPDNPYGEDVLFRGRLIGGIAGASTARFDYQTWRIAAGASGHLNDAWNWSFETTASRQDVRYSKPDVIGSALQDALEGFGGADCSRLTGSAGVGNCQFYNPFGSALLGTGTPNSTALLETLAGETRLDGSADLVTAEARMDGRVGEWNAATLDLALGLQYRTSGFRHNWNDQVNSGDLLTAGYAPDFDGTQDTFAAFAETRLKVSDNIEALLAARYETYDGSSGKLSPKLALRWDAMESLALRGSWGRGYRAPSVYTTQGAQAAQPSIFDRGSYIFANTLTSGNPDLEPETSEHLTLGAVWRPVRGLELSLDGWKFDYSNLVIKEAPQPIIDQAAADDAAGLTGTAAQQRVKRSANGAISMVQLYFINASSIETSGLDVSARYSRPIGNGHFSAGATWTMVDTYDIRISGSGASLSGVGSTNLNTLGRSLPKNRGEFMASWQNQTHAITALLHYTSGYKNDRAGITDTSIASQTPADIHYTYSVSDDLELGLGIINIADKAPPLSQHFLGYDPVTADPRGRITSISLTKRF